MYVINGIRLEISELIIKAGFNIVGFPDNSPLRKKLGDFHVKTLEAGLDVNSATPKIYIDKKYFYLFLNN